MPRWDPEDYFCTCSPETRGDIISLTARVREMFSAQGLDLEVSSRLAVAWLAVSCGRISVSQVAVDLQHQLLLINLWLRHRR